MKNPLVIVVIVMVVAGIGVAGYRAMHPVAMQPAQAPAQTTMRTTSSNIPTPPPNGAMANSVYKMMTKNKVGSVLTDTKGMTLYTFEKDTSGVSNCTGQCLVIWPAFSAPSATGDFPANISVVKRPDGTFQYAWKGMSLYYYSKDKDAGDAYGDKVGGVWDVVK